MPEHSKVCCLSLSALENNGHNTILQEHLPYEPPEEPYEPVGPPTAPAQDLVTPAYLFNLFIFLSLFLPLKQALSTVHRYQPDDGSIGSLTSTF